MTTKNKESLYLYLEKGISENSFQFILCKDQLHQDQIEHDVDLLKSWIDEWCRSNGYVFCQMPESDIFTAQEIDTKKVFIVQNEKRNKLQFIFIKLP